MAIEWDTPAAFVAVIAGSLVALFILRRLAGSA